MDTLVFRHYWSDRIYCTKLGDCEVRLDDDKILHEIGFEFNKSLLDNITCKTKNLKNNKYDIIFVISTCKNIAEIEIPNNRVIFNQDSSNWWDIYYFHDYIDFHSIFRECRDTTIFVYENGNWDFIKNYVSFPEGFYYKDTFYDGNVMLSSRFLKFKNLKSDYVLFWDPQYHIPYYVFEKYKNVICSFEDPPPDSSSDEDEDENDKNRNYEEDEDEDELFVLYEPQIRELQKPWKKEAVLAILTADLYEDDEYSWK
jgi:hypothetical protein